jgi:hypothetical protein
MNSLFVTKEGGSNDDTNLEMKNLNSTFNECRVSK